MKLSRLQYNSVRGLARDAYFKGKARVVCPICNGGSTAEACMTVYGSDTGGILATCHRAACGLATVACGASGELPPTVTKPSETKSMPSTETTMLSASRAEDIQQKYRYPFRAGLLYDNVGEVPGGIYFSIRNSRGEMEGMIVKPDCGPRKSLTYKNEPTSLGMSWYRDTRNLSTGTVYVVEDAFSALALFDLKGCAISLNGTNLNRDRLDEILKHQWKVVLMLDADATRQAIRYATAYGPDVVRVVRLVQDPKDMSKEELDALLVREGV